MGNIAGSETQISGSPTRIYECCCPCGVCDDERILGTVVTVSGVASEATHSRTGTPNQRYRYYGMDCVNGTWTFNIDVSTCEVDRFVIAGTMYTVTENYDSYTGTWYPVSAVQPIDLIIGWQGVVDDNFVFVKPPGKQVIGGFPLPAALGLRSIYLISWPCTENSVSGTDCSMRADVVAGPGPDPETSQDCKLTQPHIGAVVTCDFL